MLSVCIIAKNEEEMIGECLRSVAGIAAEIIVLDTGSTDRTVSIAEQYGCRVYHYSWDGNFTRARNTACSYAQHPWILCIDCDERVRNPESVSEAIQSAPPGTGCIVTERHNHAVARDGERSNEMRGNARLFRNCPEVYWRFEVHEETWSACITNGLKLWHSPIVLDHEVGRQGFEHFLQKQRYYEGLINNCIARHPAQHYLFHAAKTRMLFEDYDGALELFAQAEKGEEHQVHNAAFIECYKGHCASMEKDHALAEKCLLKALELIPGLSTANFYLAELYLRLGENQKALACVDGMVLTVSQAKPLTVADMYFTPVQVNYHKAFILMQTGELEAAKQLLTHNPHDAGSARPLALLCRIALIEGNKPEARHWLNEALRVNAGWQQLHRLEQAMGK